jgi:hypothetical protein
MSVTLILPASDIPDGTTVRKPTGEKKYKLCTDIQLYGDGATVVKTDTSIRFLVSQNGNINVIGQDQSLAVDFALTVEAIMFLEEIRDEKPCQ